MGVCDDISVRFFFRQGETPTLHFTKWSISACRTEKKKNRPVALRGHVTNASFKRWVGILLMPKIDRPHKNYLTPEIWEETHLRDIFYGTLIFEQSSMICIGRHVGGHTLALQHGGQNYFLLISCKRLIVTLRCAVNVTTSSFQHFPWTLSTKFEFRKM